MHEQRKVLVRRREQREAWPALTLTLTLSLTLTLILTLTLTLTLTITLTLTRREAWHRQQGELKAAERFGEVAAGLLGGVDAVALRRMRLGIMERDAQHLRGCSKATLRALEPSKAAHAQARWALHCATGSLSFLAQLSAQARARVRVRVRVRARVRARVRVRVS